MNLPRLLAALPAFVCAAPAAAQIDLNEVYVSHDGSDTMEFVELVGPPGASLDGYMILTIEGDGNLAGQLDHAWDLTGQVIPADGFFVAGSSMVANLDLLLGSQDNFDNGTQTVYLIRAVDPAVVLTLIGMDMDLDDDLITDLALDPNIALLSIIGLADSQIATFDEIYDCAPIIGPDNTVLPPGAFRPLDYPTPFCENEFLEFTGVGNINHPAPTPGLPNSDTLTGCTLVSASQSCDPTGPLGMAYCTPALPNSTGQPAGISAYGSPFPLDNDVTLTASGLPAGQFGYFLIGGTQGLFNPPGSSGLICMMGTIGRFNQAANIGQGPSFSIMVNTQAVPFSPPIPIQPGDKYNFQAWYRDFGGTTSNFTDAVEIQFL